MIEPPIDERGRLLAALAATLTTLPSDRPQPWRLCEALRILLGADGAALTVEYLSPGRTTVCSTDDISTDLENLQEVAGEGPGYDAARKEEVVIGNLATGSSRWPMLDQTLPDQMRRLRLYAVPLSSDGGVSGVATLYTTKGSQITESLENMLFLATATGAALLVDSRNHEIGEDGLTGAWSSRAVVHQATGMVMAQLSIAPHDAVALLRGHAYALGTDVNTIARRVTERTLNFSNFEVEGE